MLSWSITGPFNVTFFMYIFAYCLHLFFPSLCSEKYKSFFKFGSELETKVTIIYPNIMDENPS